MTLHIPLADLLELADRLDAARRESDADVLAHVAAGDGRAEYMALGAAAAFEAAGTMLREWIHEREEEARG